MGITFLQLRSWLSSVLPDRDDDRGASLVEYALLVALIFAVCVIAVSVLGSSASNSFSNSADGFAAN
jgi:Flp pilus assembly pilin Flp